MRLTLPIDLKNDNQGRSQHWSKAAKRKRLYASVVRLVGGKAQKYSGPVRVRLTRILGPRQRLWDADSVGRGSAKELLDAFVACGWLEDDGPKWVASVEYSQDASQRDRGPAVVVDFIEVE